MQYDTTEGVKGICPIGWHFPTDVEWTILTDFLGGEDGAGGKLKEIGFNHWQSPNTGATNISGFTALPGGALALGDFIHLGEGGSFWSSTVANYYESHYRSLDNNNEYVYRNSSVRYYSFSIRCIRDN
jgi:uncharacterized protein (TIGR02145 family)